MGHEGEDVCRKCGMFAFDCDCYGTQCDSCMEYFYDLTNTEEGGYCQGCYEEGYTPGSWCGEDTPREEGEELSFCHDDCQSEYKEEMKLEQTN